ncbi:MAG TPA: hypothetical protein VMB71_06085 [Acetobacteraceae bacterium]|nr:hypothetical protein [Acetobacteraceae bacterium]
MDFAIGHREIYAAQDWLVGYGSMKGTDFKHKNNPRRKNLLFLKKKKQKDFYLFARSPQRAPERAKVFCFFFSKKKNLLSTY